MECGLKAMGSGTCLGDITYKRIQRLCKVIDLAPSKGKSRTASSL